MVEVRIIEMEPPSRNGALHISVIRRRSEPRDPVAGEATRLLKNQPAWLNRMSSNDPTEVLENGSLRAFATCVGPEGHHWDLAVLLGRIRAAVTSYNTSEPKSPERAVAQAIVLSLTNLDP
jgi:hypothetical protein